MNTIRLLFTIFFVFQTPLFASFQLQLIHGSDHESAFIDASSLEPKLLHYEKIMRALKSLAPEDPKTGDMNSIYLTAGDHSLPGPFFDASRQVGGLGKSGLADIEFFNLMGLHANGIGNHELDSGIEDFYHMVKHAKYPFVSVNLDFTHVTHPAPFKVCEDAVDVKECQGGVTRSAYAVIGSEKIGIVASSPADFFNIANDPQKGLPGLDFYGGRDAQTNVAHQSITQQIQEQIEKLKALGINKIILLDHAQDFTSDPVVPEGLSDIDIIVTAGSTGLFARKEPEGPFNRLRTFDKPIGNYPITVPNQNGDPVLVVNSDETYRYVGHVIVTFNDAGRIAHIDQRSGPIATDNETLAVFSSHLDRSLTNSPEVEHLFQKLIATPSIQNLLKVVGTTSHYLNGERKSVRTRETNLTRLLTDAIAWYFDEKLNMELDLVLLNGGGIRAPINTHQITRMGLASSLAFNNYYTIVEMTGEELLAALENAYSRVPHKDGRYGQIARASLVIDSSQKGLSDQILVKQPSRIKSLTLEDGIELVQNYTLNEQYRHHYFKLVTNFYLASGGDGYLAIKQKAQQQKLFKSPVSERYIIRAYIQEVLGGTIDIQDPPRKPNVTHAH